MGRDTGRPRVCRTYCGTSREARWRKSPRQREQDSVAERHERERKTDQGLSKTDYNTVPLKN